MSRYFEACFPITRQRQVAEAPKSAGRLCVPRVTLHTSSKVKIKGQGHQTDKCRDLKSAIS